MTAETVQMIITISANESRREISKDIQIAEIEQGITHLSKEISGEGCPQEAIGWIDESEAVWAE